MKRLVLLAAMIAATPAPALADEQVPPAPVVPPIPPPAVAPAVAPPIDEARLEQMIERAVERILSRQAGPSPVPSPSPQSPPAQQCRVLMPASAVRRALGALGRQLARWSQPRVRVLPLAPAGAVYAAPQSAGR